MYYYIFCENCGKCCDITYEDGFEQHICEDCGEVKGIQSENYLCLGCDYFDEIAPIFINTKIDGYCDIYHMPFNMFKRKKKCKYFERVY